MTDRDEPVGYTCPLIDEVLENVQGIQGIGDDTDPWMSNLLEIKQMVDDVVGFDLGRFTSLMEEIRSANDALRTWGNGLVEDLEEADNLKAELERVKAERYEFEFELQDALNEISNLESRLRN